MKRNLFVIIVSSLIISSNCHAFNYAGIGFGPSFALKGFEGTKFFINGEWKPHKYIGTRFMLGFPDGVWFGVGLNFTYTTTDKFSKKFKWSFNGGVPFIINIHKTYHTAFIGLNTGTSFSFDIDGRNKNYLFITPVELFFFPVTWRLAPNGGMDLDSNVSLVTSMGLRVAI